MLSRDETPVLWHLELSHYNEKARWALDFKRVPHERRAVSPGCQELRARRLRAGRTVPILRLDGRVIGDSSRIIEALERRWPEPPLYPPDPDERRRALEIEERFDERYGPEVRRVLFGDNLTEPDKFVAMFVGPGHPRMRVLRALGPPIAGMVRARYDIRPARIARAREVVEAAFRDVEAQAGPEGYLVGDRFTVADLTAASILAPLVVPPEFPYIKVPADERAVSFRAFRATLRERPGFGWVEATYARHRGTSAEAVS